MTSEKNIQLAKRSQILRILSNKFKPILVQKFTRTEVYNAWSSTFFHIVAKFRPLDKSI
jgi:predicted nucleic-acid-binding Zn-ribbon protein